MGCCFPKKKKRDDEDLNNNHGQDQPLIDGKKSPGKNNKKMKNVRTPADPNPFHKPSK